MITTDDTIFSQVVKTALDKVAGDSRWTNAITRAALEIRNNPYIERGDHCLIIASPSGQVYEANGVCQCTAFLSGNPCWHRAARGLVTRYDEAIAAIEAGKVAPVAAPLPYPQPRSSWQSWQNDIAYQPVKANERAQLIEQKAKRDALRKAQADMDELFA